MADPTADPTADANVRIAWPADAAAIAAIQLGCWRTHYAGLLPPELLAELDQGAIARHWQASLTRPPDARNRVLVALAEGVIVGFAATGPSEDPDADPITDGAVTAFHVHPDSTGSGHGSRLLNAVVDTLRADGFSRATLWIFTADDPLRDFVTAAGWGADGAHREIDLEEDGATGGAAAKQVRLHCSLEPA